MRGKLCKIKTTAPGPTGRGRLSPPRAELAHKHRAMVPGVSLSGRRTGNPPTGVSSSGAHRDARQPTAEDSWARVEDCNFHEHGW